MELLPFRSANIAHFAKSDLLQVKSHSVFQSVFQEAREASATARSVDPVGRLKYDARPMRLPLLALALALLFGCASGRPVLARSWMVGKPLDLGATSLDGEPVAVGGAEGHVRAIVLWATWCRSCYELFPALEVLADGSGERGLSVSAITVDEDLAKVRASVDRLPPQVRVLWDRGAERLGERLGIEELPTIIVLDRSGVVRFVHDGTDERLLAEVDRETRALLKE